MKTWPTISHTTLEGCDSGAIVRMIKSDSTILAIVCEEISGSKGLIFLEDNKATYHPKCSGSIELFQYDCDPVLLLDHSSLVTSKQEQIRTTMGLVVSVKSGCYMNVHHATDSDQPEYQSGQPEYQFQFKCNTVESALQERKSDDNVGVAFRKWHIALANPYIPNEDPIKIFSMNAASV